MCKSENCENQPKFDKKNSVQTRAGISFFKVVSLSLTFRENENGAAKSLERTRRRGVRIPTTEKKIFRPSNRLPVPNLNPNGQGVGFSPADDDTPASV